jgi:hypothetical protein
MNIVKFSEQTVLRLCSDTETNTFKVNQVADIDSLIREIHENNSRNHSITKVEKILIY